MKTMFRTGLIGLISLISGYATGSTVTGDVHLLLADGAGNAPITVTSPDFPQSYGGKLYLGPPQNTQLTNGQLNITFPAPGRYNLNFFGSINLRLVIPSDNNTYDISQVTTNLKTFTYTNALGRISSLVQPGANIAIATNNAGQPNEYIVVSSTGGSGGFVQTNNFLVAWATIDPATMQAALGYTPMTNSILAWSNLFGFMPQPTNFNLTLWEAITPSQKQDALGFIPMTNSIVAWSNLFGFMPQPTNANLTAWAAIVPSSMQTALGYMPATNNTAGIIYALGYTPMTNSILGWSNIFGFMPQPTNANLTAWAAIVPSSMQAALGYMPATNNMAGIIWALGYTPQPASANLTNWSLVPTNAVAFTNGPTIFDLESFGPLDLDGGTITSSGSGVLTVEGLYIDNGGALISDEVGGSYKFYSDGGGNVTASTFTGNGSALISLNASQLSSGAIALGLLPTPMVVTNAFGQVFTNVGCRIGDWLAYTNTSDGWTLTNTITTAEFIVSSTGNITINGNFIGNGSALTSLNASQLSSGTVPLPQLPPGVITNNNASTAITNLARFTNAGTVGIAGTVTIAPTALNPGTAILPLGVDANGDLSTNGVPSGGGQSTYSATLGGTNVIANMLSGTTNYFLWPLTNSADNWIDLTGYWVVAGQSPARAVIEFHTTNSLCQVHFSTNFVFGTDITGTNLLISSNTMLIGVVGTFPGQATNGARVVSEARGYPY